MIKTKYLVTSQNFLDPEEIDDLINDFLEENPSIEVIDIKYQSNISAIADGGVSGTYYNNSALVIYKEGEKMIDIINYIVAHPLYCLALGFLVIVAWNIAGFNSTATNNKRSALIDKHYRKKFQKII